VHAYGNPIGGKAARRTTGFPTAILQNQFCEARKGVKFAIPVRRLTLYPYCTGLVGFLLHPIPRSGTWRDLCSPDAGLPWRRALVAKLSGGRVDWEEKSRIDNLKFYWKWRVFSSERMVVVDK